MGSNVERKPLIDNDNTIISQQTNSNQNSTIAHRNDTPNDTALEKCRSTDETDRNVSENGPKAPAPAKPGKGRALPALDGGWGWMCVVGCCLMHFLLGGYGRSFGVIYVKMLEKFDCSAATGSTIGGVFTSVRMGAGPLVSIMTKRFSVRSVTAVGALVFTLGSLLCSFASSPLFMFITYSLVSGMGGAMVYFPAIVIVGQYFDKRRGLAMGLSTAGSGLGCIAFPPIYRYLFDIYGFGPTFIIISGFTLNFLICSALYRPLADSWRGINVALRSKLRLDKEAAEKSGIDDQYVGNGVTDTSQSQQYEGSSTSNGGSNSKVTIRSITVLNPSDSVPVLQSKVFKRSVTSQPDNNDENQSQIYERTDVTSRSKSNSITTNGSHDIVNLNNHQICYGTADAPVENGAVNNNPGVSVKYFRNSISRPSGDQDESSHLLANSSKSTTPIPAQTQDFEDDDMQPSDRQPLFSSTERKSSKESLKRASVDSIRRAAGCWHTVDSYLGLSLLANPAFSCFVIGSGLGTMAYISAQNLIVAHANMIGIPPSLSVYVLSTIGIADTLGRVLSGVLFDVPVIRRIRSLSYAFILLGSGLSIIGWAFCTNFIEILALSLANGAFNGAIVTGRAVIVADLVGIENMSQAFGMTVFSQGVFIIIGPYVAGLLKDLTHTYVMSYIFAGTSSCVAAVLYLVGNRIGPNVRCCQC